MAWFIVGNRRPLNEATVNTLVESIKSIGLQTPITVRDVDDFTDPASGDFFVLAYALVAGAHRLEACRRLGWSDIPAFDLEECSDVDAEMIEIAENLHRFDLTKEQRDEHIRRYAELLKLREAAGAECATSLSDGRKAGPQHKLGIASKIAAETGLSKATVNRAINPKSREDPEPHAQAKVGTLERARKARWTQSRLDKFKRLYEAMDVRERNESARWILGNELDPRAVGTVRDKAVMELIKRLGTFTKPDIAKIRAETDRVSEADYEMVDEA